MDDLRYDPGEVVNGSRQRLVVFVAALVLVAVVGGVAVVARMDRYATSSCKSVGIAQAISAEPAKGGPDAETLVRSFASGSGFPLGREPMPTAGWRLEDGRWVSDVSNGFYRISVYERDGGWFVSAVSYCQ